MSEQQWIFSDEARDLLHLVRKLESENKETIQVLKVLRNSVSPEQASQLIELHELRKRADIKFVRADQMFFIRKQLEQASSEIVAQYKSSRFKEFEQVADLCCGIGGDAIALAKNSDLAIVDSDAFILKMAERNLNAYELDCRPVCNSAEQVQIEEFDACHIDPDRRPARSKRRFSKAESFSPTLDQLKQLVGKNRNFGIKLAPGTDWQGRDCELEFIGHQRECKQQMVWLGDLAKGDGIRATVLSNDGLSTESFQAKHDANSCPEFETEIRQYIYDPHSCLLAANLAAEFAAQNNMKIMCGVSNYLSSAEKVESLLASCFEVADILRPNRKIIQSYLKENKVGRMELKKRGDVGQLYDQISRVRLAGPNSIVLILTSTPIGFRAIACRRNSP